LLFFLQFYWLWLVGCITLLSFISGALWPAAGSYLPFGMFMYVWVI